MTGCILPSRTGLVQSLIASVDCNVRSFSEIGYQALAAPDSQVATGLTILLTLYVALIGLRLMLGLGNLRIGNVTMAALKIGLVLALATNWPVYQQLVFETLFQGPEQVGAAILQQLQPGAAGGLFHALQSAFDRLQAAAALLERSGASSPAGLLNLSAYLLLFSTLGVVLVAKILLGFLLALGPLFVGLLLMESGRGLVEGWIRALFGFALAPLLAGFALLVQLVLLAPHLAALAALHGDKPDPAAATTIFILASTLSAAGFGGVMAVFLMALGVKLPGRAGRHASPQESAAPSPDMASSRAAIREASVFSSSKLATASERHDRLYASRSELRRTMTAQARAARGGEPGPFFSSVYRQSAQPRQLASSRFRDRS